MVKGMFKNFIEGLMLLMLAGFILASISYITQIIPESTLDLGSIYTPAEFIGSYNRSHTSCQCCPYVCDSIFFVSLPQPQRNRAYLIVVNRSDITAIIVNDIHVNRLATNNTHTFGLWNSSISNIRVRINDYGFINTIQIYSVDSRISLPPSSDYLRGSTPQGAQISNRLLINVIAWVASIAIVLTALNKLGIHIKIDLIKFF